jgi:outer membrane protein assembly factor BamB
MLGRFALLVMVILADAGPARAVPYLHHGPNRHDLSAPAQSRPFRASWWKLSPEMDRVKPLGQADYGGWIVSSDLLIGSVDNDWVGAFSIKDRSRRWWLRAPAPLTAPPKVFGSWVVLGFQDGALMKVDVLTGNIVWQVTLDSYPARSYELTGSTLLVVTASQILYSLDYQTGKTNWLFDGGFPATLAVRSLSAPVTYNNSVFYGSAAGEIIAINLQTGKLDWRFNPEFSNDRFHDVVGELVVLNNRLLVSRYDGLVAAISLTGKERRMLWSHKIPTVAASAFRGDRYYVSCINGDVYAYQVADGLQLWRTSTGSAVSQLTAGERSLYLSGSQGRVTAVEISSGKIEWHDDLEGRITTPGFYIDRDLYFATGSRNLYGYKIQ